MAPSQQAPVVVFGSGTSAFLGAVRSLGRAGIPVHAAGCDPASPAGRSRYIVACHDLPTYRGDGSAWADRVAQVLAEHRFSLLIPTSDSSLAQIASHRARFGDAARAIPGDAALDTFSDKAATRALARRLGIPVAPGEVVGESPDPDALVARYGLPLIVKSPRSYRPGSAIFKTPVMVCETRVALGAALSDKEQLLIESYLPGYCRGLSVLAQDGEILQAVQHRRLRQHHRTGPSSWRRSETVDPSLLDAMARMVRETRFSGIAMGEFRFAQDGKSWWLLEVNPRIWGSIQLAMMAGADFPAAQHAMLVSGQDPQEDVAVEPGLTSFSLPGEYEALAGLWDARAPLLRRLSALTAFVARLARGRGFDSYAADDPAPFHAERAAFLSRLAARARKSVGP